MRFPSVIPSTATAASPIRMAWSAAGSASTCIWSPPTRRPSAISSLPSTAATSASRGWLPRPMPVACPFSSMTKPSSAARWSISAAAPRPSPFSAVATLSTSMPSRSAASTSPPTLRAGCRRGSRMPSASRRCSAVRSPASPMSAKCCQSRRSTPTSTSCRIRCRARRSPASSSRVSTKSSSLSATGSMRPALPRCSGAV